METLNIISICLGIVVGALTPLLALNKKLSELNMSVKFLQQEIDVMRCEMTENYNKLETRYVEVIKNG